jgi:hypothetical protein
MITSFRCNSHFFKKLYSKHEDFLTDQKSSAKMEEFLFFFRCVILHRTHGAASHQLGLKNLAMEDVVLDAATAGEVGQEARDEALSMCFAGEGFPALLVPLPGRDVDGRDAPVVADDAEPAVERDNGGRLRCLGAPLVLLAVDAGGPRVRGLVVGPQSAAVLAVGGVDPAVEARAGAPPAGDHAVEHDGPRVCLRRVRLAQHLLLRAEALDVPPPAVHRADKRHHRRGHLGHERPPVLGGVEHLGGPESAAAAALAARDVQAVAHHARAEALPPAQHVRRAVPPVASGAVEYHPPHGAAPARVRAADQVQVAAAEHGAAEPVGVGVLARHGRQRAPRAARRVEHVPRHAPVLAVALHGVQPLLGEPEPAAEAVEVVAGEQAAPPPAHQPQLTVISPGHPNETGNGEIVGKAGEQRALPTTAPIGRPRRRLRLQRVDGRPEARLHARLGHWDASRRGGGR